MTTDNKPGYDDTDDFIASLLGEDRPTFRRPHGARATEEDIAELNAELLGDDSAEASPWPPESVRVGKGDHPLTEWAWALHRHGQELPRSTRVFPGTLAVQTVEHRGHPLSFVLVGLRMVTRADWPPSMHMPRVDGTTTYGGVIQVDKRDLLDARNLWSDGEDGRSAAVAAHEKTFDGILTTFAVAIRVDNPMNIRRYVVGPDGRQVPGSPEVWAVEDGQVRRVV